MSMEKLLVDIGDLRFRLKEDSSKIALLLSELSGASLIVDARSSLASTFVATISDTLDALLDVMEGGSLDGEIVVSLTDCFRCIRNCCRTLPETQRHFRELFSGTGQNHELTTKKGNNAFLQQLVSRFLSLPSPTPLPESLLVTHRCLIQSLANMTVDNTVNQSLFLAEPVCRRNLEALLEVDDWKCGSYCCMLLSTCLSGCDESASRTLMDDAALMSRFIKRSADVFAQKESEWVVFALRKLWSVDGFAERYFYQMEERERTLGSEVLANDLRLETSEKAVEVVGVTSENLRILVRLFNEEAANLFSSGCTPRPSLDFVQLLDVLCVASSSVTRLPILQESSKLAMGVTTILRQLTSVKRLAINRGSAPPANPDSTESHFHRDVVRLLGNLCWKHRRNQDLVRELDGVPAVLDSFDIDERSPFVRQWAVFALRNLCEDNVENQEVVAGLQLEGVGGREGDGGVLEEMGLEVEIQGGKPRLRRKRD